MTGICEHQTSEFLHFIYQSVVTLTRRSNFQSNASVSKFVLLVAILALNVSESSLSACCVFDVSTLCSRVWTLSTTGHLLSISCPLINISVWTFPLALALYSLLLDVNEAAKKMKKIVHQRHIWQRAQKTRAAAELLCKETKQCAVCGKIRPESCCCKGSP